MAGGNNILSYGITFVEIPWWTGEGPEWSVAFNGINLKKKGLNTVWSYVDGSGRTLMANMPNTLRQKFTVMVDKNGPEILAAMKKGYAPLIAYKAQENGFSIVHPRIPEIVSEEEMKKILSREKIGPKKPHKH